MNASKLKIRKGESVRAAWERLVWWVETLKIVDHPDVKFRYTPHGVLVKPVKTDRWRHPWRTSGNINGVQILTGTVNGVVPSIKTERDGLKRIDGRDEKGVRPEGLTDRPVLPIDKKLLDKNKVSYICLKIKQSLSAEGFEIDVDKMSEVALSEDLTIVQRDTPKGEEDGFSYYPLAMLHFTQEGEDVERIFPITHHNLRYTFQERNATEKELEDNPDKPKIGQGIFYPV